MGTGGGNVPLILIPTESGKVVFSKGTRPHSKEEAQVWNRSECANTLNVFDMGDVRANEIVAEPIGVDFYNQAITGKVTATLRAAAVKGVDGTPCALVPYTLKIRSGCEGGGKGALIQEDKSATLSCNNDQTLFVPTQTENGEVIYLARKLTPTECASLQGFEKDWCALVPHKDSAEYKMWGNGMAFPCMLYIMEGVQEVLAERYLDNLFGGDTAEP